uniref:Ig-like domain-containing protein n=1 Tax=Xenopus tropicalis TaxID=8364 RepID=A0A6I8Q424_XENTR
MEDSGIFTARFLVNGERREISYILTIFDPVPTPDIKMEMEQISPDWCNFTLHCSAPTNPSALSYSWMYRHKGRYQPYPNGTTIRVSLQPESWDGEYLCLVQNPADQKNVSIAPREFCPHTRLTKATTGGYNSRSVGVIFLVDEYLLSCIMSEPCWHQCVKLLPVTGSSPFQDRGGSRPFIFFFLLLFIRFDRYNKIQHH